MEKIMYLVWRRAEHSVSEFRSILTGRTAEQLEKSGALGYRVCVTDEDSEKATSVRIETLKPQPDAILAVWVDSSISLRRAAVDAAIEADVDRYHAYVVTESEPMPNTTHVPRRVGDRTDGMNQIVLLSVPARMSYEHWLEVWLESHSLVGMGTQSVFSYRQNIVVRSLSYGAPVIHALVEENFPEESMTDHAHYYDAEGAKAAEWDAQLERHFASFALRDGEERWQRNVRIMQESVGRFIDHGQSPHLRPKIDCMPLSEYVVKPLARA